MRKYVCVVLLFLCGCAYSTSHIADIRSHPQYTNLTDIERTLLEEIMEIVIDRDERDYYFKKLNLLLSTPVKPPAATKKLNKREIKKSVEETKEIHTKVSKGGAGKLEKYLNKEEDYENSIPRN